MKVIRSTSNTKVLVSDEDYDWIRVWPLTDTGYKIIFRMYGKPVVLARRIKNVTDPKICVDHHDRNYRNNQRENLRVCSKAENSRNRIGLVDRTSKYKGVDWDERKHKWRARIRVDGKEIWLGYFDDEKEAAKAYNKAALIYHKEFALLNDI